MKVFILLSAATIAAVLGGQPETSTAGAATTNSGDVKAEAAGGRHRNRHDDDDDESYEDDEYNYNYPSYGNQFFSPRVLDNYVCDLDASFLLVVSDIKSHRSRHSFIRRNAIRVKCSDIANGDEDSCNTCCQQAARKDISLPNDKLFGFLSVTSTDDDKTFTRTKRSSDDDEDDRKKRRRDWHKVENTYLTNAQWTPPPYNTNVKCICCAPRTGSSANSPPATNPYQNGNANTFQAPAAAQPAPQGAWGAAAPAYDAPAAAPIATPAPTVNYNNQY